MYPNTLNTNAQQSAAEGEFASEITLYHAAHSTCSQKVRLCLAEKGLRYKSHLMHLGSKENLSDAYLQLNPNGVVPTLVDGGEVVIDSSVICEYLDDAYPDRPLTPASPIERARMRSWMRYFEEVPTAAIRIPSINMMFMNSIRAMGTQWHDIVKLSPLRKNLYEQIGEHGFDDKTLTQSIQSLYSCCVRVEATLTDGAFLLGNDISIADMVLLPCIVRMDDLGLLNDMANWPKLWIWYKNIQARESYRKCYFDGSRVSPDP